jgi:hypothetical protein
MLSCSNPPVIEPEMAGRLVERRVDDRIFDDELTLRNASGPLVEIAGKSIPSDFASPVRSLSRQRIADSRHRTKYLKTRSRRFRESVLIPRLTQNEGPERHRFKPATLKKLITGFTDR